MKRIRIHDPRLETRRVSNFFAERKNADGRIEDSSAAPGHSHVSLLIEMGFSAVAIADRLGHESIEITYRYAHLFPTKQNEMADQLDFERMGEAQ